MTPVVIPLSEASEWNNKDLGTHIELRYLIRSIIRHVPDPHIIVVGHRPEWLRTGAFTQQGITSNIQCTHLPAKDDHFIADTNMIRKISLAARHLQSIGHKKGFLRCSDDQLFLKDYRTPTVYHRGFVSDYITKKLHAAKVSHEAAMKGGSAPAPPADPNLPTVPVELTNYERRLFNVAAHYDEIHQGVFTLNTDMAHVPIWILSPENWLKTMDETQELWDVDNDGIGVTLNTLYVAHNMKEIANSVNIKPATEPIDSFKREVIRPVFTSFILASGTELSRDVNTLHRLRGWADKSKFLCYNSGGINDRSGWLARYITTRFATKSILED